MDIRDGNGKHGYREAGHAIGAVLFLLGLGAAAAQPVAPFTAAQLAPFTYPGCAPLQPADFKAVKVVDRTNDRGMAEPLKMDFVRDAQGRVGIFYIERTGNLKYYDPATRAVRLLGTVNVQNSSEDGLTGIALDPDFQRNNRIFLFYAHATGFRIARFTLDAATRNLDPASEKVLLTIPSRRGQIHTGGALRFDAYGDLWITCGDNRSLRLGPANTHDLRGGILRIHPEEDGTYSIPKGNLWEYAAAYFEGKGMPAVAAQYRDTSRMRRERYVMGTRNPYSLTIDPVRRWATYGDVGPDEMPRGSQHPPADEWTEEHTVITHPAFAGWPFWAGVKHVQATIPVGYNGPNDGPAE